MENEIVRLVFPQWIGGNRQVYGFGAKILDWLTPTTTVETIDLPMFEIEDSTDHIKDGIAFKNELLEQSNNIYRLLVDKSPKKIITLGGDCSVSLVPFVYLLEKYQNDVAVLWIDRHGDISIPGETTDYHAMVLASLLGEGDHDFANFVTTKLDNKNLLHIGVNNPKEEFSRIIGKKYNFKNVLPEEFAEDSNSIIDQIDQMNVNKVMIHLDLDVLDLSTFRSQSSANPDVYFERLKKIKRGSSFSAISRLINDIDDHLDIVGLSIAEYLPWDLINLNELLAKLPLLK